MIDRLRCPHSHFDSSVHHHVDCSVRHDVDHQVDATMVAVPDVRGANVVVCTIAVPHGGPFARAEHLFVELPRQMCVVLGMCLVQGPALVAHRRTAELAHRIEQPVLGDVGRDIGDHQRVVDELVELIGDGEGVQTVGADQIEHVGAREMTGKDRKLAQQCLQCGIEVLVRPFEGVVQHSVTLIEPLGAAQQPKSFVEVPLDLLGRH